MQSQELIYTILLNLWGTHFKKPENIKNLNGLTMYNFFLEIIKLKTLKTLCMKLLYASKTLDHETI
jgi:hypothetical protein